MKKYFILGTCLLLGISNARAQVAQVTVGSNEAPRAGAILDLKSEADGTSFKGLALPRVKLTDKDNLYPMFETTPGSGLANDKYDSPAKKAEEDKRHLGLMVYSVGGCDLDGNGVYTWTTNGWEKLANDQIVRSGLSVSTDKMSFYNGLMNDPQEITVAWSPNKGESARPTYTTTGMPFYISPPSGTFAISPQKVGIQPKDFTEAELKGNPFLSRTGEIVFELDNSICNDGNAQTHKIEVTQIHKAITLNGKLISKPLIIRTAGTSTIAVASNAKWTMTVFPKVNAGVSSPADGNIYGVETDVNKQFTTVNLQFTTNLDVEKSRRNTLVFSDSNTPKRFEDIHFIVTQCPNGVDMTLEQYRDRWEEMYGLNPTQLEPNDSGDITKNTHKVQWHYDQDGNIFFSALFGGVRWMTTNLAAQTFASGATPPPAHLIQYGGFDNLNPDVAMWGYPSNTGKSLTYYNKRQRIGLWYNWYMATGRRPLASYGDEKNKTTRLQGICPNGWHLPNFKEANALKDEVEASPQLYSYHVDGQFGILTIKDVCERPSINGDKQQGQSFDLLDGGFAVLYGMPTEVPMFWTSCYAKHTSFHIPYTLSLWANLDNALEISNFHGRAQSTQPVRCIKN